MRFTILAASVIWLLAGCEKGPGPTRNTVEGDTVLVSRSHDGTTPRVRTAAFESGTHDERFIRNAASAARMQVELGRIALRQASDTRVKQYGRRMIDDHQKAERDLLDAADARDIIIPPGMTPAHRSLIGQIAPLSGEAFDREYIRMMVGEQLGMVREYDEESRNALDPHVRDYAEKTLPTLRDHLEKSRALASALSLKVEDEEASVPGAAREAERDSPSPHQ